MTTTTTLTGRTIVDGVASGEALVTQQPINFTAAMTKVPNILPSKRAEVRDQHHELFGQHIRGKILVFPACIGSTHTGLVLLDLVKDGRGPAAMIVQRPDSLLLSGVILADVWYNKSIPVIEYPGDDLYQSIHTGQTVTVSCRGGVGSPGQIELEGS